jgi:large subunit ribosomal protein L18
MKELKAKNKKTQRRSARIRAKITGTTVRPRLSVHKSNAYIQLQAIDDTAGTTVASVSSRGAKKGMGIEVATKLGADMAAKLKEQKIETVVFDKGAYKFHGGVKAVADALRENGIKV